MIYRTLVIHGTLINLYANREDKGSDTLASFTYTIVKLISNQCTAAS